MKGAEKKHSDFGVKLCGKIKTSNIRVIVHNHSQQAGSPYGLFRELLLNSLGGGGGGPASPLAIRKQILE